MRSSSDTELELLNIQIGCILRLARLKKGLSQLDLGNLIDSNPTQIGRIERSEGKTSWENIYILSKELGVGFQELFQIKSKDTLLSIIKESLKYEAKLTQDKKNYYTSLEKKIKERFKIMNYDLKK